MRKILVVFLVCLPLLSFNSSHKFYVSTTDVEFIPEDKELQVITKLFIDDLENLLKTRYDEGISLGEDIESENADTFIERYFSEKFTITVNGKTVLLSYLGNTYEDDVVKCFLKVENVSTLNSIEIKNTLLMDLFDDQQNVVHVDNQKKIKSLLLMRDREDGVLNFR